MDLSQKTDVIQQKLKDLGISHVYFEPPQNVTLEYPCAVVRMGTISSRNANNRVYKLNNTYEIIYIRRQFDDNMVNVILVGDANHAPPFSMIRHIRHYTAEGLHHDLYKLYYN